MTTSSLKQAGSLTDPRYHDLCGFFKTQGLATGWIHSIGDWVYRSSAHNPGLIATIDDSGIHGVTTDDGTPWTTTKDDLIWLPRLDQIQVMMIEAFGTTGSFTSSFNGRCWWFKGNIMGTEMTNLIPLAEGASAEEAGLNALIMNSQR